MELYEKELLTLRSTRYTFDSIIGVSDAIRHMKHEAIKAASNSFPVLITGRSGTGKELFAQAIHHGSSRRIGEDEQNEGIDIGLIAMFLKMTPEERLRSNDNAVNAILELRNAFKQP